MATIRLGKNKGKDVKILQLRCKITSNFCGTDTWAANHPCKCDNCQKWLSHQFTYAQKLLHNARYIFGHELLCNCNNCRNFYPKFRKFVKYQEPGELLEFEETKKIKRD